MKHLLFITTSSLAANPRLVKEFEALKQDFDCHVVCFKHHDWSLELSEAIKIRNPEVRFFEIDRHQNKLQTVWSKMVHKVAIAVNGLFPKNLRVCTHASNDKTLQLWYKTKSLAAQYHYDRVIAHNLGAFYPAVQLSEKKETDLQLDIEDFYPGEALYFNKSQEKENRMQIMAHSFLRANIITYASEGIFRECETHFSVRPHTEHMVLINVFKASDFNMPMKNISNTVKCVWFSQRIGPNRGLEHVFNAAEQLNHIEFHLIGNANEDYLSQKTLGSNIILHDSMKQEDLHEFLSQMDIGLALENADVDPNRNICLTNKILAYFQAGCYIVATNTFGQSHFLNSLGYNVGVLIDSSLEKTLQNLNMDALSLNSKINRWQKATLLSWENEEAKLKRLFQNIEKPVAKGY